MVVLDVAADATLSVSRAIPLPDARAPRRREEIPAGLAVSPDGKTLYVCGNLSNTLLELDVASGRVLRVFDVGVAPYDVVLTGGKAYVSNWGGRRPGPGELTGPAGRGTVVKVDPVRHVASEGSVTVIDLASGKPRAEIVTGLHASALAVSPDGRHVVCANAASDTLTVIDTRTDTVVETIWAKPSPADLFGAQPNALAFDPSGRTLYVANGTQNAVAVVAFAPAERESKLQGLIPVGWFPGALVFDAPRRTLHVANIKGHAALPKPYEEEGAQPGRHRVQLAPLPRVALAGAAARDARAARPERDGLAQPPPRAHRGGAPAAAPRPARPRRARADRRAEPHQARRLRDQGEPHLRPGAGRRRGGQRGPALCIFGARVTPNQHKLVREFVLLDNTYCAGILSADGHQWSTTAIGTDYLERSFAGWPRSYPDGMGEDEADALAYSPAGFLWDNALRHGVRIRNYGEFMAPAVRWRDPRKKGTPPLPRELPDLEGRERRGGLRELPHRSRRSGRSRPPPTSGGRWPCPTSTGPTSSSGSSQQFVARGEFPQLTIICLPNDHTSGTSPGSPTPAATVADNDLAFGRIVEALSHSPFWREMAIFAIEDDPQNGFDHVSGYRTTAYVASPYAKRGQVVSTQYNTTSLLRTLEQILGLPPMNQFDASAVPMWDAFTDTPDYAPFVAVPSERPPRPDEPAGRGPRGPGRPAGRPRVGADELPRGGQGPGGRAQPDPLARREGHARAVPGVGDHGHRGRRR